MFKSKNTPLQFKYIETFEKEFSYMIPGIKFRSIKDTFQKNVIEDIANLKQSPNVLPLQKKPVISTKCLNNNIKNILHDNVTKTYKKAPAKFETSVNLKAKTLLNPLNWMTGSSV